MKNKYTATESTYISFHERKYNGINYSNKMLNLNGD